jgi:hypothetical protein
MEIAVDVPVGSLDMIGAVSVTAFGVIRFHGVIFFEIYNATLLDQRRVACTG